MSDPVFTLARRALRAQLLTIRVANGYRTTVASVRMGRDAQVGDTRDDFPILALFSLGESPTGDTIANVRQLNQYVERTIQLEAILYDQADDYEDRADALLEDIRKALSRPLAESAPLGGAAFDLILQTVEFVQPGAGSQYPGFRVQLRLTCLLNLEV